MKKFKKIFAAIAASALVAAMSFTSMAASITINHDNSFAGETESKQKYKAYKILDVVKDKEGNPKAEKPEDRPSRFAYTIENNSKWLPVLKMTEMDGQRWFDCKLSADKSKYVVTLKSGITIDENGAEELAKFFYDKKPEDASFVELTAGDEKTAVDDGYYLITSDLGTNLILATSDIVMTEKNKYPRDAKKVATSSVITKEKATYYITVEVPTTVNEDQSITVHDELNAKLSFNNDVEISSDVTTNDFNINTSVDALENRNYVKSVKGINVVSSPTDGHTFDIVIDPKDNKFGGKTFVFKYTATLSDEEIEAGKDYTNTEYLTYTNDYKSIEKSASVKTYDFNLMKTFSNSDKESSLTATFNLYKEKDYNETALNNNNAMSLKEIKENQKTTGYVITDSGSKTITAADDVALNILGLSKGTYYLVETNTAKGYNLLDSAVKITIGDNGEVSVENANVVGKTITVNNEKGILLPSTGGMGTVAFAVVGLIVMAGAAVTLIIKKRA